MSSKKQKKISDRLHSAASGGRTYSQNLQSNPQLRGCGRGEEHNERQPPTEEQNGGPPSETEVKSVEKGHEHVRVAQR